MKPYDTFTFCASLRDHQAISPGEIIDDNGVKLKVIDIQKVEKKNNVYAVYLTVREIPEKAVRA